MYPCCENNVKAHWNINWWNWWNDTQKLFDRAKNLNAKMFTAWRPPLLSKVKGENRKPCNIFISHDTWWYHLIPFCSSILYKTDCSRMVHLRFYYFALTLIRALSHKSNLMNWRKPHKNRKLKELNIFWIYILGMYKYMYLLSSPLRPALKNWQDISLSVFVFII